MTRGSWCLLACFCVSATAPNSTAPVMPMARATRRANSTRPTTLPNSGALLMWVKSVITVTPPPTQCWR
ncbi:hypothetical protein [Xylella fastidiosa]|uniref:hypothetical protein n=1 Tax=Xylella fastidiosa TaxID=2371 RepID=UPI0012BCD6D5|nr:hypothetical protein [Xylella fastidiosa]UIX80411.1 hypothetical protein LZ756_07780 [Xylella fastidiosa subsp. sandyi]